MSKYSSLWEYVQSIRRKRKPKINMSIQVNRDSVCMGDDCDSHETRMVLPKSMKLSQLLQQLADYVPSMKNVIWAIRADARICGYIITDSDAYASFELCGPDRLVEEMNISSIMCKYYYPSIFFWMDGKTGTQIEKYPECKTFFEKVQKDNA